MATLLSTVSHLCEEGGPGGVAESSPERLNSVLSGSAQVLGSSTVLPRLGLGGAGAGGIRGSGGFTLGSLTGSTAGPGTGSSLSSLASAHLSSVTPPEDSLTRLSLQDPSLAPSLSALASTHLAGPGAANTPPRLGFSLGSLQGPAPGPGSITLSALASTHLAGSGATRQDGLGLSQNKIPAVPALTQPHLPILPPGPALAQQAGRSPSPRLEIDLMAALKVGSTEEVTATKPAVQPVKLETLPAVEILVPLLPRPASRPRPRSSLAALLTRRWRRVGGSNLPRPRPAPHSLPSFQFLEPSPDDIVKQAQTGSRAFNRPAQD